MQTISIACDVKDFLPLDELNPFQGKLKDLTKENYAKLKNEILQTGFAFPILVWRSPEGVAFIIGGHQRVRCLLELRNSEGFVIPPLPVVYIRADSFNQAKRRVLQDASQYGNINDDGLLEFAIEANLSLGDLDAFQLPEIDLKDLIESNGPETPKEKKQITCPSCGHIIA